MYLNLLKLRGLRLHWRGPSSDSDEVPRPVLTHPVPVVTMSIWKRHYSIAELARHAAAKSPVTLMGTLEMRYEAIGEDYLVMSLPVSPRTHQPMGLLHGGASVALAEEVGSVAANLCLPRDKIALGQEINANHLRGVRSGRITATARPVHLGGRSQVWGIEIRDDDDALICISRLTIAVGPRPPTATDIFPFAGESASGEPL